LLEQRQPEGINSPFVGERNKDRVSVEVEATGRAQERQHGVCAKDSTGGRGQIFKDLKKSSGGTTFSHALAKLRVEEFAEEKGEQRLRPLGI
jgi:hypothetical protein